MQPRHLPVRALGVAVRAKREERGLSQAQLASRSGLHVTYVSGLERGKRNASWDALVSVANGLDVSLSALVARAESEADADGFGL